MIVRITYLFLALMLYHIIQRDCAKSVKLRESSLLSCSWHHCYHKPAAYARNKLSSLLLQKFIWEGKVEVGEKRNKLSVIFFKSCYRSATKETTGILKLICDMFSNYSTFLNKTSLITNLIFSKTFLIDKSWNVGRWYVNGNISKWDKRSVNLLLVCYQKLSISYVKQY